MSASGVEFTEFERNLFRPIMVAIIQDRFASAKEMILGLDKAEEERFKLYYDQERPLYLKQLDSEIEDHHQKLLAHTQRIKELKREQILMWAEAANKHLEEAKALQLSEGKRLNDLMTDEQCKEVFIELSLEIYQESRAEKIDIPKFKAKILRVCQELDSMKQSSASGNNNQQFNTEPKRIKPAQIDISMEAARAVVTRRKRDKRNDNHCAIT